MRFWSRMGSFHARVMRAICASARMSPSSKVEASNGIQKGSGCAFSSGSFELASAP